MHISWDLFFFPFVILAISRWSVSVAPLLSLQQCTTHDDDVSNKSSDWSHLVSLSTSLRSRSTHQHRKQLSSSPSLYPVKSDPAPNTSHKAGSQFRIKCQHCQSGLHHHHQHQSVRGLLERRGCRFCILSVMMTSNDDT